MSEPLPELLLATASVLHWLGKYHESNTLILLSRLLRVMKIDTLDDLRTRVEAEESK